VELLMRSTEFISEDGSGKQSRSLPVKVGGPSTDALAWQPGQTVPAGWLQAWRGNARTGTIETLPLSFNPNAQMTNLLSAYKWARDRKLLPVIPPETWAALAMVEGREDFGYNGLVLDNRPQQQKFLDQVMQAGMTDFLSKYWIVFLQEKLATAKRLSMPFYRVWNGSSIYQARFDAQVKALQHPKNEPFLNWFKQQLA
jgi:hypothetical protein